MPRGLIDPTLQVVLAFHHGCLRRNDPEDDALVRRHETQWREAARARAIVFKEIEADVERIEQTVGHVVVASLGMPLPPRFPRQRCMPICTSGGAFFRMRLVTAIYLSISASQSSPRALSWACTSRSPNLAKAVSSIWT